MGLSTTHDAAQFSYSGFSLWRTMLAEAAGIIRPGDLLFPRKDFDPKDKNDTPIDWDVIGQDTDWLGNWTREPRDPLFYLLAHADDRGIIRVEHMARLGQRLEEFADDVDDRYPSFGFRPTDRFIRGLQRALQARENIEFH